ncbi:MAG: proton-conducting transporter membrane subunit [Nitrososphaerota archaeon]|nr:cation:proton antiporter [Candidatus Calditenuaceae archaeon]MDW8073332.1 proton-conducting transporter membrane subunit [Nitrososphaerota archaeon]
MVELIPGIIAVPVLSLLLGAVLASPLIVVIIRSLKAPRIMGIYASAALAYALWESLNSALRSENLKVTFNQLPGSVIMADGLTFYFTSIVLGIGLLSAIYSMGYIKQRSGEFYTLLLVMVLGMVGVFFSGDFVTFFIFWEVMSISSYLLVAFNYREWEAVEASLKYLIMSSTGSAAILFGLSLLYGLTGTLEFSGLSAALSSGGVRGELWNVAALVLIVGGLGVNIAMSPFHYWLPDAHPAAPSPISAMLSGVVIKTGVYAMVRVFTLLYPPATYDWAGGLMALALLTMTIGNLMASFQSDIKRLLAFSSIANIGYIALALSINTPLALAGGLLHVLNHAIAKALLFLSAGCLIESSGTRSLDELSGVGRKMPLSAATYSIGAFSLAGIPGLNAFVSEYMIILAAFSAGHVLPGAIMLVNVIIGALYHLRVVQIIFLKPETAKTSASHEAKPVMLAPVIILSALCVLIGVYASPFLSAVIQLASVLR